ncbi:MAG: type I DNA topoisomerase [Candidatus Aureabacteria bacterium]|nr:type I DNA topoisomerase [Candidatus Auribacterota bacterium]
MAKSLVIVESPAKAKTINRILGKSYTVMASMGHVRDLPKSKMGVDTEADFSPRYIIPVKSRKIVTQLKRAAEKAQKIYLAPDPDREGEAIAWHLQEVLNATGKPFFRVAFNEITDQAVRDAFAVPAQVDFRKVESQQARRILDRIVGYKLSPLLWEKVARGLSAGRVQSVAVKLICEREVEIRNFKAEEYWSIEVDLEKKEPPLERLKAKLARINGEKAQIPNQARAEEIARDAPAQQYRVQSVEEKERRQKPYPPYITSTLQQAGVNRLRWPIAKTMKVAQELYEGLEIGTKETVGLITYMRTDSFRISTVAQGEALKFIREKYGDAFAPPRPNIYRSRKGAQEAHEAVRPTSVSREPHALKSLLTKEQFALYRLIWERFVASQMTPAVLKTVSVEIAAGPYLFRAADTRVVFEGYLKVAGEKVGEADETALPPLRNGEQLTFISIQPAQHFTAPPPRYTEATLVKELEEKGIGRPSTYSPIISTIRKRDYVNKEQGRFQPTQLGEIVNGLLVDGFPELINVEFTALMENKLDAIEEGKMERVQVLREFYEPFMNSLTKAMSTMKSLKKAAEPTSATCEKCGHPMVIRYTLKGQFLACSAYPRCRNIKPIIMHEDGSFTIEKAVTLDEKCPQCGSALMERHGRYGKFIACTGYPACRYIKPKSTGVNCPQPDCGGYIVKRRGRGGAPFYGCSNYPKCRFSAKSIEEISAKNPQPVGDGEPGGETTR